MLDDSTIKVVDEIVKLSKCDRNVVCSVLLAAAIVRVECQADS